MGRIFGTPTTERPTQLQETDGRIFGGTAKSTPVIDDYINAKWEDIPIGQKVSRIVEEIPKVLYHFLPPATREFIEKPSAPEKGVLEAEKEFVMAGIKGAGQFYQGIAKVTADAIGGGILGGMEKIVGKPVSVDIPLLGEVSSWGVQKKQMEDQGFSSEEASALVGINAYLGIVPIVAKGLKTETGKRMVGRITTKEVPFAETPEGMKQAVKTEVMPQPQISKELEPLVQEARKYKSAEKLLEENVFSKNLLEDIKQVNPSNEWVKVSFDPNQVRYGGNLSEQNVRHLDRQLQDFRAGDKLMNPAFERIEKAGLENKPIVVEAITKKGEISILDGSHRLTFAREKNVLVEAYIPKSQLTDFYNQAVRGTKAIKQAEITPETTRIERPVITGVKRIFGKTKEQQDFNALLEDHLEKYFEGRRTLLGKEDPLNQSLLKLTDEELQSYSYATQGITTLEKPSANLKSAIDLWKKTNQKIETDLIQRGKLVPEQVENRRWKPIETITGRNREQLKEMGIDPVYYPYLAEDLLKKSDFIPTTGKRTKGGYLKRFTGKMLAEDSYIKNPRVAIPRHRVQVFRDKMNAEFVETIRDTFGEIDKAVIEKYRTDPRFAEMMGVEEWKPSGSLRFYPLKPKGVGVTKKVESYWIPKEVANELNRFYKPGKIEKALRMTYDPLIDMWRVSVLSLVPRWLYNNFVGNTMLSILGKTDPFAFGKAAKEMFARTQAGEKIGITQREIPKGVFQKRYAGGEAPAVGQLGGLPKEQTQFLRPVENWLNLLEQAKNYRALRIPASATQNLIRGWIALGKPIESLNKVTENWFRGAMYISKTEGKFLGFELDKPVPPAEGLSYVNEFLFDYSKLTRAERATFRRALPFYNWMKNITEFSFKFPANHPMRGLITGALLQDYVDYINEVNQKEDKAKSVLRIKTDMTYGGKPLYLNVKSAIPFSDVFRTLPTDFEAFGRFLTSNPVSKLIIERAFRLNSFTGQPFTQPKELQEFDEFGKPIAPLPSLPRHLGQQFPQVKLGEQISDAIRFGKPLRRTETGEPKIVRGQIQTADLLMEVFAYFGIRLNPIEYNKIKENTERKERKQEPKKRKFEYQIKTGLDRLETE